LIEIPAVPVGTKFSRWRPPNNFWYIKDSNITSGAQRKIFEKGTLFFGHPVDMTVASTGILA
jgi:aminopeptidase-like protein